MILTIQGAISTADASCLSATLNQDLGLLLSVNNPALFTWIISASGAPFQSKTIRFSFPFRTCSEQYCSVKLRAYSALIFAILFINLR